MSDENNKLNLSCELPEIGGDIDLIDIEGIDKIDDDISEVSFEDFGDKLFGSAEEVEYSETDDSDLDILGMLKDSVVEKDAEEESIDFNIQSDVSDLYTNTNYSEEFIDAETMNFIKALNLTMQIRSNPTSTIQEPRSTNIVSKNKNKEYAELITIMKGIFDSVQKYNSNFDINMLPHRLREKVNSNCYLQYNGNDSLVWNEFYTKAYEHIGSNVQKLNRFKQNISDIKKIFDAYAKNYDNMDEYLRSMRERRDKNQKIDSKAFAFFLEVLRRLECGYDKVTLCNSLTFNSDNDYNYQFQCGRCKETASGSKTIKSTVDNSDIVFDDTQTFYQVLTSGPRGLHYPLVCEHCGAINVMSTSTRRMLDDGIKKEPSASSRDTTDFRQQPNNSNVSTSSSSRRVLSKGKWMDLLEDKLVSDDYNVDYSDLDLTQDEILDKEFYINTIDESVSDNGLISEVDDSVYVSAIKYFRQRNDIINCKKSIEMSGNDGIEGALALLAANGNSTFLSNIFGLISSYVINTKMFNELKEIKNNMDYEYDRYLTILGAYNLCNGNEIVPEYMISEFENNFKIKYELGALTLAYMDAQRDYEKAKSEYDKYIDIMFDNIKLFGYKSRENKDSAIEEVSNVFNKSDRFSEFMILALKETIINSSMINISSSFGYKVGTKKIISDSVKGLSSIKDREHIQMNKYKTVKEYASRFVKSNSKFSDNIKKLIDSFNNDYTVYLKYKEWIEMFGYNSNTDVSAVLSKGDSVAYYNKTLEKYCGPLNEKRVVGDLKPKFYNSDYFKAIFGECSGAVKADSVRTFNNLLELPNFGIYDIIFSRIILTQISFNEFTGMSSMDIASNIKLTNGLVIKYYSKELESMKDNLSTLNKNIYSFNKLRNHLFLHTLNSPDNIESLIAYCSADSGVEENAIRQKSYVVAEFDGAIDLELNIPLLG